MSKNIGRRKFLWNDDTIMQAMNRFYSENGKYPTSHEFQFTDYLPDPKTIVKLYGGLPAFRKKFDLGVEDYTKGEARSSIARDLNDRAKSHEDEIQDFLVERFGEICVHKEREFSYRNRVDFQVYHAEGIFGVDTFYPKHRPALVNIFNLKYIKYKNYSIGPIYLVCMNDDLTQELLNEYVLCRKSLTEGNIKLVNKKTFIEEVSMYPKRQVL